MNTNFIGQAKSGDELAFELLFRKYYVQLCSFANKFTSNTAESEEIVQEVFLNIWKKRDQLKLKQEIRPYLFKSVQNMCFNIIQHRKVIDQYHAVINIVYQNREEEFNTYELVLYHELQTSVDKAISSLPTQCRRIFQMSRKDGLKYTEIAERMNISVKTVETQMSRALAKLKVELKDYLTIVLVSLLLNHL